MNVSIVEIDPIVHQFAEEYFGLPRLTVAYEDGRAFIERAGEKWDYIVHDVFTGGSVPKHLFTAEMWSATKAVLSTDGVVAVVRFLYVLMRIWLARRTIYRLKRLCRHYCHLSSIVEVFMILWTRRKQAPLIWYIPTIANQAIFCAQFPIEFRTATKEDFQGSVLREQALSLFKDREITLTTGELLLTDAENGLKGWQIKGALEHWRLIRTVLADEVWINY
jgi:Spermine/spermidine synthase domain